ncbi:MAG: phage gp6-like head-tail connector protein [Ruminococcaceae bacterium]|nr:phage gp6-like head-tail connector protein [Oscillospiraceae bacterium]
MKLSEVTTDIVMAHCGCSDDESRELIEIYSPAAKKYVADYTSCTAEQLDEYDDIPYAFLCIACEMYSNRSMTVDVDRLNPLAKSILDLRCRSFIA